MAPSLRRTASGPNDASVLAAWVREQAPAAGDISVAVTQIVSSVRDGGDAQLGEYVERFDGGGPVRVSEGELDGALAALPGQVRAGLELAIANVGAVARAGVDAEQEVELQQGQKVLLREIPVRRAAIYVPGGRAPYPSSVVMGVVTAQAAGVEEIVVCAPGAHPVILGACALCGVREVHRMGGAHAIAALAYGTASIERVDVIVGPGGLWVQEAKRQVSGDVGIDGFAGPSDLLVIASAGAEPRLVAADLLAQAEHGEGTLCIAVSDEPELLDAVQPMIEAAQATGAVVALIDAPDLESALALSEAFAPEHLELQGGEAEALAPRVRSAGCIFVGSASATAFGDYIAGSNHTLPTAGAARFASGLNPRHFRRRMAEVRLGPAASLLAGPAAAVARAEGFELHAVSMEVRENERR